MEGVNKTKGNEKFNPLLFSIKQHLKRKIRNLEQEKLKRELKKNHKMQGIGFIISFIGQFGGNLFSFYIDSNIRNPITIFFLFFFTVICVIGIPILVHWYRLEKKIIMKLDVY